jgi:hypothetical protein
VASDLAELPDKSLRGQINGAAIPLMLTSNEGPEDLLSAPLTLERASAMAA